MVSEEWIYFNVNGKPEAETFVLDELLRLLANKGISLEKIIQSCKITGAEAEALRQWQAHGRQPQNYLISSLLLYLGIIQSEAYDNAIQLYYDYINSFHLSKDVVEKQSNQYNL